MSIEVADSLNVGKTDVVLDVRSRIEKEEDIYNIKYPVRGGLVYCLENEKFYVIKTLVAAEVNGYTIANYKVGTYEELNVGGAKYTAGDGISISEDGVISCTVSSTTPSEAYKAGEGLLLEGQTFKVDWDKVAKKSDIKVYSAGENITISESGVISAKDTKYSVGDGIEISAENVIAVDWKKVAKKEDIKLARVSIYGDLENRPEIVGDDHITVTLKSAGAVKVAGAGNTESDGDYVMDKISATGASRVWRTDDRKLYYVDGQWRIVGVTDATIYYYLTADETADPWSGSWKSDYSEFEPLPTVSKAENGDHDVWSINIDTTALISVREGKVFTGNIELLTRTEFDETVGDMGEALDIINRNLVELVYG
ncbi:MAG: hypothetical protein IKB77_04610 [Lentisphaeria bacterium]|nr:hypothetical protein [Lentisphaeria bacterium]